VHTVDRHLSADGNFDVHAYPCRLHAHCRPLTPHTSCSGHRAACRSIASVGVVGWSIPPCPWFKSSRPLFHSCTLVTTCSTCSLPPAVGASHQLRSSHPSRPPGRDFRCCQLGFDPFRFPSLSLAFYRESTWVSCTWQALSPAQKATSALPWPLGGRGPGTPH
jgi:hypothetical protein